MAGLPKARECEEWNTACTRGHHHLTVTRLTCHYVMYSHDHRNCALQSPHTPRHRHCTHALRFHLSQPALLVDTQLTASHSTPPCRFHHGPARALQERVHLTAHWHLPHLTPPH